MTIVPFVHEGLGNSSYLVPLPGGKAALVDPDRSAGRYLATADAHGRGRVRRRQLFSTCAAFRCLR